MYYDKSFWRKMNSNLNFALRMNRRAKLKWFIAKPFVYSILLFGRLNWINDDRPIRSKIGRAYVAFVFNMMRNARFASDDVVSINKAIDFTYKRYIENLSKRYEQEDDINA